jgi:thiol-disulfide isomerase/thioredoxin
MLERFLLLLAGAAIAVVACFAWRAYQRRRLAVVAEQVAPPEVAQLVDGTRPAVLYFTTPDCAQCRLQQAPILSQLGDKVDVAVHKLDAVEQEALARFYGIMTVPTTVVLDPHLRPVAVNHGVTPLPKLLAQVGAYRS